jgi:hypothetical protein
LGEPAKKAEKCFKNINSGKVGCPAVMI